MQSCWTKFGKEFGIAALTLSLASGVGYAATTAVVSGVVRDTQGVAQMGAMVQVLAVSSANVATAFTDMYGRYRIANLVPGRYQVQASAALFVPATRRNLQLATGMRATVNLTLTMLADPAAWLPAERRKPDEPGDDWTWTLRSAATRTILRMLGDGEVVSVSADAAEAPSSTAIEGRASVTSGDGSFGESGLHSVVALDRPGSGLAVRTDVAGQKTSFGGGPAAELGLGYESGSAYAGSTRLVVSYAWHPEMMSGGGVGMQVTRMASARKMHLGDAVDVEAGGTVYAIHTSGTSLAEQPFLRVTVHPGEVWAVRYSMATSSDLQGYEGLDSLAADLPVAAVTDGGLCLESGRHQEIAVIRKAGAGSIQAAVYHDSLSHPAIGGVGRMTAADTLTSGAPNGVVVDTTSDSFRYFGAGYTTTGLSLTLSEPLTPNLWATLEYEKGGALAVRDMGLQGLPQTSAGLHPDGAGALTMALKGRSLRTGTKVRASYRWQGQHLVTAVDPYAALSDRGYLSFYVRQAMRWGDRLPPGLEATIDVTNLLEEGYQPFLSADGRTLFLAQTPRTIRGGLSFTF